jgi:hypothetical protein
MARISFIDGNNVRTVNIVGAVDFFGEYVQFEELENGVIWRIKSGSVLRIVF